MNKPARTILAVAVSLANGLTNPGPVHADGPFYGGKSKIRTTTRDDFRAFQKRVEKRRARKGYK